MGRRTTRSTGTGLFSALVPLRSAGLAGPVAAIRPRRPRRPVPA